MQIKENHDHPLQQWQEALWLLLALLIPLFVNFWVEQQFEASKIWLLRLLVGVLALLWLAGRLSGQRSRPLPAPFSQLTSALFLVLALATLLSENHFVAIFGSLDRANGVLTQMSYLALFAIVATRIDRPQSRRLLQAIILTGGPLGLLGLAQAAGWQPLPVLTDARTLITTTLGRANFTGAYLALLLPLTLAAAQTASAGWPRRGYLGLFALELLVIALTQARAAWIAAVVAIGVLVWLQAAPRWSRRVRRLSGFGGLVGLAGALLLVLPRGLAGGGSIAARWTIWQASLRLLWPRLWLGYGADSLELVFPSVYPPQLVYYQGRGVVVDRAHNWLLDWSLNYGVVATLILVVLVATIWRAGWRRLAAPAHHPELSPQRPLREGPWLAACLAAISGHLAGNLFLFDVAATALLFWLLLALVTAAVSPGEPAALQFAPPRRVRLAVMGCGIFLMSWLVWQGSVRPLLADIYSWRGTQALNEGNRAAALAAYTAAVEWQPQQAGYHVALALTAAQSGDFEMAERAMFEAIARRPADPVVYTRLAAVYALEGVASPEKIELAYAAYDRAIALAPTIGLLNQRYADLALRSGDRELALRQARRAVDLDATDGVAFAVLGWVQLQEGSYSAAQDSFEQAVRWEPGSADFYLGLATTHYLQGDVEAARPRLRAGVDAAVTITR